MLHSPPSAHGIKFTTEVSQNSILQRAARDNSSSRSRPQASLRREVHSTQKILKTGISTQRIKPRILPDRRPLMIGNDENELGTFFPPSFVPDEATYEAKLSATFGAAIGAQVLAPVSCGSLSESL